MMRTTLALLAALVLLASCNQYKKTPSGLAYKITGNSKEKLKHGQFVKLNIEFKIAPKDTVFKSSFGHVPAFTMIDTSRTPRHSFLEVITKVGEGDKLEFVMSVDTLKKYGELDYNEVFHAHDQIKGKIEILKVYKSQEEAAADRMKELDLERQKEVKDVQAFVTKKGIKTQSTRSGALVEIEKAGDPAIKADTGKVASILYKGFLMNKLGGKPFDYNTDPGKPLLNVLVGSQGSSSPQGMSVIAGLDEALRMFGKGGKGKVYIPAMLGYGDAGSPPVIPEYANLVFEVEVVDVKDAPPPAPAPMQPAPMGQPRRK